MTAPAARSGMARCPGSSTSPAVTVISRSKAGGSGAADMAVSAAPAAAPLPSDRGGGPVQQGDNLFVAGLGELRVPLADRGEHLGGVQAHHLIGVTAQRRDDLGRAADTIRSARCAPAILHAARAVDPVATPSSTTIAVRPPSGTRGRPCPEPRTRRSSSARSRASMALISAATRHPADMASPCDHWPWRPAGSPAISHRRVLPHLRHRRNHCGWDQVIADSPSEDRPCSPVGVLEPAACQNPCRASDLGFYPRRSCSFASSISSWSGCSPATGR